MGKVIVFPFFPRWNHSGFLKKHIFQQDFHIGIEIYFIWKWKKCQSLIRIQLFVTPCTVAHQAPLSMGFPWQEYWSGLPFSSPGGLPDPGIEPGYPALQADSLLSHQGSPYYVSCQSRFNAWYWMLGASALGRPRGMVWGGRREKGSGWGTHVYLWRIHFDIWQN